VLFPRGSRPRQNFTKFKKVKTNWILGKRELKFESSAQRHLASALDV
jgi:hypothetical protein